MFLFVSNVILNIFTGREAYKTLDKDIYKIAQNVSFVQNEI